jgi:hypothetical protein
MLMQEPGLRFWDKRRNAGFGFFLCAFPPGTSRLNLKSQKNSFFETMEPSWE